MIRGLAVTFISGAAVMALEILSSRWLAPSVGFTLSTWAWLISVTLLFGALGAMGGARLSRHASWRRVAFLLSGAAVWIAALGAFAPRLADALLSMDVATGAALGAVVVLAVPVLLLSAVLPVVVGLLPSTSGAGSVTGRLLASSTAGSLCGTLGAAFVLVPHTGLALGAYAITAVLLLAAAALWAAGAGFGRSGAAGAAVLLGIAFVCFPGATQEPTRQMTPYGELRLVPGAHGGWHLTIDGIRQAGGSPLSMGPGALIEQRQYVALLPFLRPGARSGLCVGLGSGQVAAGLAAYGIAVTSVEINPTMVSFARDRFGFNGRVLLGDGRAVWRRLPDTFDLVIVDAFQGESLPGHLVTQEAFRELEARLSPGGAVCLHLIGGPDAETTKAVYRTLQSVFPHTMAARSGVGDELQDLFLFASSKPLLVPNASALRDAGWLGNEIFTPDIADAPILTDDRNPIDVLNAPLAAALRAASRPAKHP